MEEMKKGPAAANGEASEGVVGLGSTDATVILPGTDEQLLRKICAEPEFERTIEADRWFFQINPDRRYRARRGCAPEVHLDTLTHKRSFGDLLVVVNQIKPGVRIRWMFRMDWRGDYECFAQLDDSAIETLLDLIDRRRPFRIHDGYVYDRELLEAGHGGEA
jgi:hypothetical protein